MFLIQKKYIPNSLLLSIKEHLIRSNSEIFVPNDIAYTTTDDSCDCNKRNFHNVFIGFSIIDYYLLPVRSLANARRVFV